MEVHNVDPIEAAEHEHSSLCLHMQISNTSHFDKAFRHVAEIIHSSFRASGAN